jgi:hypothetical protein
MKMRISDIILESTTDQVTVFYGGRFQPMHQGHYTLYQRLVKKFGSDNVFIATTFGKNQQAMHASGNYSTDPFNFKEKAYIMNRMFGIPLNHIVDTQPYRPEVNKVGRQEANTAIVLAFSEKDAGRLKAGGVLAPLPDDVYNLQTADEGRIYFETMPVEQGGMSATDFRKVMASNVSEEEKQQVFKQFFGKYDAEIFKFIEDRLT